jgi:hypothetical protein
MTDTGAVWAYEGGFKIVKGKLNYFNRAYGALLDTDATLFVRRHMYFKDIEYVKGMEASIQIVKNGHEIMNACPAQNAVPSETRIYIGGPFFNDGTGSAPGSGDATGDIAVYLGFYKFSDSTDIPPGYMGVRARLFRCTNSTCTTNTQLDQTIFDNALVKIGKKTVLRITWDQASDLFTFNVGKKIVGTLTYTLNDSRPPEYVVGNARIGVDHYLSNCPGTGNAPRSVGWADILVDYVSTDPKVWP